MAQLAQNVFKTSENVTNVVKRFLTKPTCLEYVGSDAEVAQKEGKEEARRSTRIPFLETLGMNF